VWWVYFVSCRDGTIYAGATSDLKRRLREHNTGKRGAKYTMARLPVRLVQAWQVATMSEALRLEIVLKKCSRSQKNELISNPGAIRQLAERRSLDFPIIIYNLNQETRGIGGVSMFRIALIAHDAKKPEMIAFASEYKDILSQCDLYGTGTTGRLISEKVGLAVTTVLSGPLGGDQQIGSMLACQTLDIVIFLRDPLTAQPHEPDITALLRVCDVHNTPLATNRRSAEILIKYVKEQLEENQSVEF